MKKQHFSVKKEFFVANIKINDYICCEKYIKKSVGCDAKID